MDIEKLINTCIDLSKEYCHYCYEVMEEPTKTNRVYDKVQRNYKELKAGKEGQTPINVLCRKGTFEFNLILNSFLTPIRPPFVKHKTAPAPEKY